MDKELHERGERASEKEVRREDRKGVGGELKKDGGGTESGEGDEGKVEIERGARGTEGRKQTNREDG